MSSFIVGTDSIDRIVNTLSRPEYQDFNGHRIDAITGWDNKKFQRFARELWITNHKSVRTRYKHHGMRSGFCRYRLGHTRINNILTPVQLYKSMQCLSYQCGDLDVDPPVLVLLDKIIVELAGRIVANLPEYDLAEWG